MNLRFMVTCVSLRSPYQTRASTATVQPLNTLTHAGWITGFKYCKRPGMPMLSGAARDGAGPCCVAQQLLLHCCTLDALPACNGGGPRHRLELGAIN